MGAAMKTLRLYLITNHGNFGGRRDIYVAAPDMTAAIEMYKVRFPSRRITETKDLLNTVWETGFLYMTGPLPLALSDNNIP
jgi:hypothetical protein